jgi:hypothetical protein
MPKHKLKAIAHPLLHFGNDPMRRGAIRALVVPVFDERHRCLLRSPYMVPLW